MSYRPDPTRQGIASLPYADVQMPTTTRVTPLSVEPLDRDLMMDALMRGVNNLQSNPQLGTISDPTVTAFNIGSGPMTEDPAVVAERNRQYEELMGNIGAAAKGEPLPSNENMYGRGMQDLGDTYQDSSLNPQLGTINDPTAQAGLGSFFTETVPGFFSTTPAQAKAKANENRFKGSNVRTKPTGFGDFGKDVYQGVKNIYNEYIG